MTAWTDAVKAYRSRYRLRVEARLESKSKSKSISTSQEIPINLSFGRIAAALVNIYGGIKQPSTYNGAQAILNVDFKTFLADLAAQGWEEANWVLPTANLWVKGKVSLSISRAKKAIIVDIT